MPAKSLRSFWITAGIGWLVLGAAAAVYAHLMKIPAAVAISLALAFLLEYPFYLLPAFPAACERLMAKGKPRAAALVTFSAIVPWLAYALGTDHFNIPALMVIGSIAVLMCFWYVALPAHPAADLLYLGLFGALTLFKVFARVYPMPWPKLDLTVLGKIMLIRTMAFSFVAIRGGIDAQYRFIPTARECLAGLRWFAYLLPVAGTAYWALGLVVLRPHPLNIGLTIGTFFGILWVVAISEEFIFRGLLQPWIARWTSSPIAGVIATAILFGSVHLGMHNRFPNWRFSIVAAIAGFFYGLARKQTGGIQAGMVTHALTVAVWQMFFTY
jgi:membrane protease YdiL (CAAX protease family)